MDSQRHVPHVSVHRENQETARPPKSFANRRFVWRNQEQVQANSPMHSSTFQFLSVVLLIYQQNFFSAVSILTLSPYYLAPL